MIILISLLPLNVGPFCSVLQGGTRIVARTDLYYVLWGGLSAVLMVILLMQASALRRTVRLQATLGLFAELQRPGYTQRVQRVFDAFCDQHFQSASLPVDSTPVMRRDVMELIRLFGRVGVLIQNRVIDRKAVFYWADVCVKVWYVSQTFREKEIDRRGTDLWQVPLKYMAALSLQTIVGSRRLEWKNPPVVRIYHSTDSTKTKEYNFNDLRNELRRLEYELTEIGMSVSSFAWPARIRFSLQRMRQNAT